MHELADADRPCCDAYDSGPIGCDICHDCIVAVHLIRLELPGPLWGPVYVLCEDSHVADPALYELTDTYITEDHMEPRKALEYAQVTLYAR